ILAQLDLAGESSDLAGLADVQPGAEFLRQVAAPRPARRLGFEVAKNEEDGESAAQRFDEVAAVQVKLVRQRLGLLVTFEFHARIEKRFADHRAPPFSAAAAFDTARAMRE